MNLLVSNIQRFCLNDGPGIRTTVFTMGCNIRCPWCCNPENLTKVIKKGKNGIEYGKNIDSKEIFNILIRDKDFYKEGGGVTFSGGEFLLNIFEYKDLLLKLKEEGIHLAIETSLYAPKENLLLALEIFDLFIIDFKIIDRELSKIVLKADSSIFKQNIEDVLKNNIDYIARIPLAKEIANDNNIEEIIKLLLIRKPIIIEVFKIHNLATSKYENLNLKFDYSLDYDVNVDEILNKFKLLGFNIKKLSI